ncbi:hypothetical protein BV25DRAFT_1826334 [Artomyces pyxidatus]|uniref:Uncharacterized protein n=1 Tax=Artomyces pyxidatus TaxID=48021 RepID=A0ACB8SYF8_9AGAM|nr:hypothetical protein BV25DRAFT_1826334 [Artomyces pyxidatus]
MAAPAYQSSPLAGRPPFATNEPDSHFANPQPQPRYRQPPQQDPNARSSAYNHYDGYLDQKNRHSGVGSLGMALMNGDMDSDDEDDDERRKHPTSHQQMPVPQPSQMQPPQAQQMPVPLAAPRPGYAAPVGGLRMPQPSPSPDGHMPHNPPGLPNSYNGPRVPPAAALAMGPPKPGPIPVPSTPHPLPPTMTPIQPVFARPAKVAPTQDVKFGPDSIMRGNSEEKLLPRRGEKGDDFWRRFSMVAKEERQKSPSQKQSAWLRKTQNGTTRMSRWVWIVGLILLALVGLGIGLGMYISHKSSPNEQPKAIGGSANESIGVASSTHVSSAKLTGAVGPTSSSPHVSPTNTVARRDASPGPAPTGSPLHIIHVPPPVPHRKRHLNRTSH